MKTIQELTKEVNDSLEELNRALEQLREPFAGFIDPEAVIQAEDDKALDHYNDEQVWVIPLTKSVTSISGMTRTYTG